MPDILSYLRSFRHLIHLPDGDGELLQRFRVKRDELAFATLVQRHGPMVLGIAQRILGQSDLLEDVFQATFLVLAKRGRQMETWPSVAGWLVQVARRTALQARAKSARRTRHEKQAAAMTMNTNTAEPADIVSQHDLSRLLDAELAKLPSKYRTALVLCHLEGQTKEETARQLGWPVGSVSGRLARGKKLLQARLLRKGIVPALATGIFTVPIANAHLPSLLIHATTLLASNVVHHTSQVFASTAVVLAQGVMTSMLMTKVKYAASILLVLGLCLGTGAWAWQGKGNETTAPVQVPKNDAKSGSLQEQLQGLWVVEKYIQPHRREIYFSFGNAPLWRFRKNLFETFQNTRFLYESRGQFQLDESIDPVTFRIDNLTEVKGIVKLSDGKLYFNFTSAKDNNEKLQDFGEGPLRWTVILRRATDYDRLEGIWRREERNPVTNEIVSAEELIFKKNMYIKRYFREQGPNNQSRPMQFSLNETASPKELDLAITGSDTFKEKYTQQLKDKSLPDQERKRIENQQLFERHLGIYELKDNEFKYIITGSIPYKLINNVYIPDPKSPLNKRAASFATATGNVVTFKRVERSLKDTANPKMDTLDDPTSKPRPRISETPPTETSVVSPTLQDLRQQRLKLAQERLKIWQIDEAREAERRKNSKSTTTFPLVHLDGLVVISQQVLDASLALATDKEAKVKIMEEHLKVLKQIEDAVEQNGKQYTGSGSGFKDSTLAAKLRRIEFEIQLEELKAKP